MFSCVLVNRWVDVVNQLIHLKCQHDNSDHSACFDRLFCKIYVRSLYLQELKTGNEFQSDNVNWTEQWNVASNTTSYAFRHIISKVTLFHKLFSAVIDASSQHRLALCLLVVLGFLLFVAAKPLIPKPQELRTYSFSVTRMFLVVKEQNYPFIQFSSLSFHWAQHRLIYCKIQCSFPGYVTTIYSCQKQGSHPCHRIQSAD